MVSVTPSFSLSLPAGFWSKAYITLSEEADEVAIAITMNRSTPNELGFFFRAEGVDGCTEKQVMDCNAVH